MSALFKEKSEKCGLDSFSFVTLERYYEKVLSVITYHTDFHYNHGKLLTRAYSAHWHELLDSKYGNTLLKLLNLDSNKCILTRPDLTTQ